MPSLLMTGDGLGPPVDEGALSLPAASGRRGPRGAAGGAAAGRVPPLCPLARAEPGHSRAQRRAEQHDR